MKKLILSLFICSGIAFSANAQSSFLEKGQNGFGINAGFSTNDDVSGFEGSIGYSFSGVFDLGLSVGRFGFDQQLLGEDLNATTITPSVSYFIVKQDEDIPVSFSLDGAYERQFYSNNVLRDNNIDMTGNFFGIGASLYSILEASDAMRFQPKVGFSYITGELKIEDSSGASETEDDDTTLFTLGLSLIFHTSPNNSFVITPSLGISDDVTTFGITLNFIFPQN